MTFRKLSDICFKVTSGGTPSRKRLDFYDGGFPWVKTKELNDNIILDTEEHINEEALAKSSAKLLPKNTVLMAMYGATVGKLGILGVEAACNQACIALIVNPEAADYRFIYYLLAHNRSSIVAMATGAAQQNLSGDLVRNLEFEFPSLPVQAAVADILSTLDEKIRLNTELSKTLEAIAQTIFKSWFIDFDPVHAKMRGEKPEGMDDATAALFPDSFEESELGLIPKGWEVEPVENTLQVRAGNNKITKALYVDEGFVAYSASGPDGFVFNAASDEEAVIVSGVGANCGRTFYATGKWTAIANTQVVTARYGVADVRYFYWLTKQTDFFPIRGSAQPFIAISAIREKPILRPDPGVLAVFSGIVGSTFHWISSLDIESKTLAKIRDTLLPRLISGELEIPEEMLAP